jgi:predicted transcriptional regulator
MSVTSIKIDSELRDRLAHVASADYAGVTLGEALQRLIAEHEERMVLLAYERLRADEQEWASYRNESRLTDNAAGDWLRQDPAA